MSRIKEPPIFSKHRINFNPSFPLTHLCVANGNLILAMQNKVLLRVDLKSNPEEPQEIDFLKTHSPAADAKISNMYLDPSGQHLFITFAPRDSQSPCEVMYLNAKSMTPKEIPKLTSHNITAIAWSPTQLEEFSNCSSNKPGVASLQPILVGTSKGLIFEVEITASGEVKVSKQLFDIGKGNPAFICGLEYFFVPRSNKCFILAATSKKLYQFHGFVSSKEERPLFASIFNSYLSQSSTEEVLEFSEPSMYSHHVEQYSCRLNILNDSVTGAPKCLGYLTDIGSLVFKDVVNSSSFDTLLKDVKMIPYESTGKDKSAASSTSAQSSKVPRSIVVTEYHVVLLQHNTIKGICALNEEVIFEDAFDEHGTGKILSIVRDPADGLLWFFTERSVHKYTIHREDRNIWKIYLAKQDFAKAQETSGGDVTKMEAIAMGQADYYFAKKEYEQSAMYYALTKASFEEIALKFVQIDDSFALKTFLLKKLSSLQSHEATKVSVLVLWILEIYLNQLGTLRDFGKQDTPEYHNLEEEFLKFMGERRVTDCVKKNKKAVYDLMSSHGDRENLIHFTLVMKDYDEVIEESIASGHYENALRTLQNQKDTALYSRFIPILLDKDPAATMNVLISGGRMLNPTKLLPKFSSKLDKDTAREITRYLEHCVNVLRITDKHVHDYLLALYVHYYDPAEKLIPYLSQQGNEVDHVRYDPKYGLNMCLERKLYKPAIHLYTIMGLYEEAIALAIQVDLELAKKTANVPENDEELRKKLWLRIAKHVVKEKNDIQQAMEFLQQCDLLKIEDILPFFPNFVTIDHFKDAICASLQEYNRHIQNLKDEMEEATKSAEVIREEIQNVRSRCAVVKATDQCTLCSVPLLIRNFYVFPCGHNFHADCLLGEVFPLLSQPRRALLSELQKKLEELALRQDVMSTESGGLSVRDQVKSEIDDIIASECIYCGDHMIKLIDTPFIPDQDYDRVQREWD